jgi:thiol-disulfide isomerase/thioredoxin
MARSFAAVAAAALLAASSLLRPACAGAPPPLGERAALELAPSNFDAVTSNGSDWMIMFYASWCGACKVARPEFEAAAREAALEGGDVAAFAAVDAATHRSLGLRFGING